MTANPQSDERECLNVLSFQTHAQQLAHTEALKRENRALKALLGMSRTNEHHTEAIVLHLNGGGLCQLEPDAITAVHQRYAGDFDRMLTVLKIPRSTLYRRLKKLSLVGCLLVCFVWCASGQTRRIRSPRDTSSQPVTSAVMPALPVAPTGPFLVNLRAVWDASPSSGVTNYAIHFGGSSKTYTNMVNVGLATLGVVSNILSSGKYYFAIRASDNRGAYGPFSNEVPWPMSLTNYITARVSSAATLTGPRTTLWSVTLTNPPGDGFFLLETWQRTKP